MMLRVTVRELAGKPEECLRLVRQGETIEITEGGQALARLERTGDDYPARLADLGSRVVADLEPVSPDRRPAASRSGTASSTNRVPSRRQERTSSAASCATETIT